MYDMFTGHERIVLSTKLELCNEAVDKVYAVGLATTLKTTDLAITIMTWNHP